MGISTFPAAASGPTLAEITTAITTNAAPASVTNSSIATQVANNAPSSNNWTLVATSASLDYNTGSVTFSGLSGYKTYKILIPYIQISGAASALGLRINNDASADFYPRSGWNLYNSAVNASYGVSTYFYVTGLNSSGQIFFSEIIIENNTTSTPKIIRTKSSTNYTYGAVNEHTGACRNTTPTSSLTVYNADNSGVFGYNARMYLFGAN